MAAALRLDAPREDVLARATELIAEAWRSFDRFRPEEPPLDEHVLALLREPLSEEPTPALEALAETARILDVSIAQPRPRYFAFIASSGLEIGVIGDALASCFDVNLAVYAAAATEVERQAVRWVADYIGFPAGGGTFTSGGTVGNLTALVAAREHALPESRAEGFDGRRPVVYTSTEAHYSVKRAVEILGFGARNLRLIPVDGEHRLDTASLEDVLDADRAAGATPVAVVANAGTTLTGAVDPLEEMAELCEQRGVWLHVDGAYGLAAARAPSAVNLFAGLERADSVTLDAHKWLYLPKACGVVLVRDRDALQAAFSHRESYMPHGVGEQHAVESTLEYSRPFRSLKLWLAFRVHGAAAIRAAVERNIGQAKLLAAEIRKHADLELLMEPALSVVPFRHVPAGVQDLNDHNLRLAETLQADGRVYVAAATIDDSVWLRPCIVNFRTSDDDVRALVAIAREVGDELAAKPLSA